MRKLIFSETIAGSLVEVHQQVNEYRSFTDTHIYWPGLKYASIDGQGKTKAELDLFLFKAGREDLKL